MDKPKKCHPEDLSPDYEVGFGKPPKATQFKKGQSGNPRGRPKGSVNLATIFRRVINEKIVITENGKQKSVSKGEAAVKQLANGAAKGNLPFIRAFLPIMSVVEASDAAEAGKSTVDLTDPSLLAPLLEQLQRGGQLILAPDEASSNDDATPQPPNGDTPPTTE